MSILDDEKSFPEDTLDSPNDDITFVDDLNRLFRRLNNRYLRIDVETALVEMARQTEHRLQRYLKTINKQRETVWALQRCVFRLKLELKVAALLDRSRWRAIQSDLQFDGSLVSVLQSDVRFLRRHAETQALTFSYLRPSLVRGTVYVYCLPNVAVAVDDTARPDLLLVKVGVSRCQLFHRWNSTSALPNPCQPLIPLSTKSTTDAKLRKKAASNAYPDIAWAMPMDLALEASVQRLIGIPFADDDHKFCPKDPGLLAQDATTGKKEGCVAYWQRVLGLRARPAFGPKEWGLVHKNDFEAVRDLFHVEAHLPEVGSDYYFAQLVTVLKRRRLDLPLRKYLQLDSVPRKSSVQLRFPTKGTRRVPRAVDTSAISVTLLV